MNTAGSCGIHFLILMVKYMNGQYKAMPYKITNQIDDDFEYTETRYAIVDTETGEIVDDAQGYGYKTAPNAYKAFGYKSNHSVKKKRRKK